MTLQLVGSVSCVDVPHGLGGAMPKHGEILFGTRSRPVLSS